MILNQFNFTVASGARPGDSNFNEKVNQQLKRFFIINEQTAPQKSLDDIESEASKFAECVKKFWKHTKVQGHIDRIPKDNAFFDTRTLSSSSRGLNLFRFRHRVQQLRSTNRSKPKADLE